MINTYIESPEVRKELWDKFMAIQTRISALKRGAENMEREIQPPELIRRYIRPLKNILEELDSVVIALKFDILNESILDRQERESNIEFLEYHFGIKPPQKRKEENDD